MNREKTKVIVIRSAFNPDIVNNLYKGVKECFNKKNFLHEMNVIEVPGAFEIPYMAKRVLDNRTSKKNKSDKVDCIITLGCVIKGETAHFEYISNSCASTLSQLTLQSEIPIMFGVITAYTKEQALNRSQANFGNNSNKNIGYNVANAAIEILSSKTKHNL